MGLTKAETSPGLSLEFDEPRQQYTPGDVVSGRVVLNTADNIAIGTVVVSFWGRAKTRIIQQHGQSVTYHRGRTQFFTNEKLLYEGQYTHKPGSFSWTFEFVVPEHADPQCILHSDQWKPKEHFRSNKDPTTLDLSLPPSMYHNRITVGRQAECFVEYVLEASITEPEGLHHIRKAQTKSSTYPITFHPLSTPEPIQDWHLAGSERLITVSSLKLLPEHAGTSLGFRDRARSIFQRDSIPRFSFSLKVQAPGVIQMFHPGSIPFLVTATPDLSPSNTTIDVSQSLPEVVLRSAKLELRETVRCRGRATYSDSKTHKIPMLTATGLNQRLKWSQGLGKGTATLDLGALYDLRANQPRLGPNFHSYHVSRIYTLTWELEIECGGKTEKFCSVRHGPSIDVLLPSAVSGQGILVLPPGDTALVGPGLSPRLSNTSSTESGGSSGGFWRRRCSNEERRSAASNEKEKPGFGTAMLDQSTSPGPRSKTKAEEAAEDWTRDASHSTYLHPYTNNHNDDPDANSDLESPFRHSAFTAHRARTSDPVTAGLPDAHGIVTDVDVDRDSQLPKYVP